MSADEEQGMMRHIHSSGIVLDFLQKFRTQNEDIFLSIFIHSTCCVVMSMQSINSLNPKVGGLGLPGVTAEVHQKQQ